MMQVGRESTRDEKIRIFVSGLKQPLYFDKGTSQTEIDQRVSEIITRLGPATKGKEEAVKAASVGSRIWNALPSAGTVGREGATALGAFTGARIGAPVAPPWGAVAGAGIGALGGNILGRLGNKVTGLDIPVVPENPLETAAWGVAQEAAPIFKGRLVKSAAPNLLPTTSFGHVITAGQEAIPLTLAEQKQTAFASTVEAVLRKMMGSNIEYVRFDVSRQLPKMKEAASNISKMISVQSSDPKEIGQALQGAIQGTKRVLNNDMDVFLKKLNATKGISTDASNAIIDLRLQIANERFVSNTEFAWTSRKLGKKEAKQLLSAAESYLKTKDIITSKLANDIVRSQAPAKIIESIFQFGGRKMTGYGDIESAYEILNKVALADPVLEKRVRKSMWELLWNTSLKEGVPLGDRLETLFKKLPNKTKETIFGVSSPELDRISNFVNLVDVISMRASVTKPMSAQTLSLLMQGAVGGVFGLMSASVLLPTKEGLSISDVAATGTGIAASIIAPKMLAKFLLRPSSTDVLMKSLVTPANSPYGKALGSRLAVLVTKYLTEEKEEERILQAYSRRRN